VIQSLFSLYNPWWTNPDWGIEGVPREIFQRLYISIREKPYITVLKGTRQSGKTFLIKYSIATLLQEGIRPQNIFYFLLDDPELAHYIEDNPNEFGNFLLNESKTRGKLFVFFDEFQKVAHVTDLIKLFYESTPKIKFVLTGSSSLLVANKVSESLLGRTETFILTPFSFKEFLSKFLPESPFSFPSDELTTCLSQFLLDPANRFEELKAFYQQYKFVFDSFASDYLPRYLLTGGYPQAVLASTVEEAFLRLKEIKQTFIEKDIIRLLRVERLKEFDKLLRVLALQTGSLLNYNDLQNIVGVNYQTLMSFFNILKATYLWSTLPVFTASKITSIKKRPKSYFNDVGLRNFLASVFNKTQLMKEKGPVAENFAFTQLVKFNLIHLNDMGHLYFWRSPDGNEVDFILEYGDALIPLEVKYQELGRLKITRGLQTFLKREGFHHAVLLTEGNMGVQKLGDISYYMIPMVLLSGI